MLLNQNDKPYGADKEAIKTLFEMHRGAIRLVILNACYSKRQAELITSISESVLKAAKWTGVGRRRSGARARSLLRAREQRFCETNPISSPQQRLARDLPRMQAADVIACLHREPEVPQDVRVCDRGAVSAKRTQIHGLG